MRRAVFLCRKCAYGALIAVGSALIALGLTFPGAYGSVAVIVFAVVMLTLSLLGFSLLVLARRYPLFPALPRRARRERRRDVSELKRLERIRQDFVANASHELKTPVTAIRGIVETLIDDLVDKRMSPEMQERFLRKIWNQSLRLSSIVTDLLTISRLESEGGLVDYEMLDLRDAVLDSARALIPTGEERGLQVTLELPDTPVEILGDEEALCQLTNNLLDNALKYTPQGGRVWVRLRCRDTHAVIEVEDTGIGIQPCDRDRIFERFYRVDKARSRELGGTGLGLSIVKHIVLAHGGHVSVESVWQKGSIFRISIPLTDTGTASR